MRPRSNLRADEEFKLDAKSMRSGFVGLYQGRFGSKNAIVEMAYKLVTSAFIPMTASWKIDLDDMKSVVESVCRDQDRTLSVRSVLKKNMAARRLEYRTPIARLTNGQIVNQLLTGSASARKFTLSDENKQILTDQANIEAGPLGGGKIITGKQVTESFGMPQRMAHLFGECLLQLDVTTNGEIIILWATFAIKEKEVEYLTNSSFLEMRLSDIYPTLVDWTATVYGRYGRLPLTISKVSKIATSVRETIKGSNVKPRVGIDGIVTDIDGGVYYIPEVDQSREYEQQLMDFGLRDDGSYTWRRDVTAPTVPGQLNINQDGSPVEPKRKLPVNMPIFSDWLNDKFVYSNTTGNMSVYDLSDTQPFANFNLSKLLNTSVNPDRSESETLRPVLANILSKADEMDPSIFAERPRANDFTGQDSGAFAEAMAIVRFPPTLNDYSTVLKYGIDLLNEVNHANGEAGELTEGYIHSLDINVGSISPDTNIPALKFIGRMFAKAQKVLWANKEALYTKLSVMSALQLLAYSHLINKYGGQAKQIEQQDEVDRNDYLTQGVDPEYKVQPIPLVPKLVLSPHQVKVDNITRNDPKNVAYPVDAGGGKSIIIITNILNGLQKKKFKRPIIECPSTLVSQYVEECVYVTHGALNVIPVTNSTLRMHGEERLKMMIEMAPINTVVVTDMDFIKGRKKVVAYGNKSVIVWTNAEWLRQFEFDYIAVDESHKLSNIGSARREATMRFMQDIPYKRIASGTLVNNTITDLVSQVALLNPTIFGSKERFNREFAGNTSGTRVLSWKPGAEEEVHKRIGQHVVMAGAKRKEWAALLPPAEEKFHAVEMSENQRLLYESILKETTDLIEEAMAKDPELKEAMESEDDSIAEGLEAMLKPYMIRLERFLSAPDEDEAASLFLKSDEDRISPKVKKIYEICHDHINKGYPGKILIFTNYLASAEAVFKFAPADLKSAMIHYTAENKMEARSQLANNPKKLIMVGASSSMDTGLNLQNVSRLIRMETIWTPGLLEQGNARIYRPQMKSAEERTAVYFDWLMVNRTIDVTKISRLVSKIVSKAKFDEHDSPAFQEIPSLPVISMKMESIRSQNDFAEELMPYLETYQTYKQVQAADFEDYRVKNEGKLHPVKVEYAGLLPNSKLMSRLPYVPGMTIYGTTELGLIRFDEFVREDLTAMEIEDTESENGEGNDKEDEEEEKEIIDNSPRANMLRAMRAKWIKEKSLVQGMPVHTEFGDGTIINVRRKVVVKLTNTGERIRVPKLQTFIITRTTTNAKDMRNELLKSVGKIPLDKPIEVPVEKGGQTKRIVKEIEEKKNPKQKLVDNSIHASFNFAILNDMMAITFDGEDNSKAASALQNFGFQMSPDFTFARIRTPVLLLRLFKAWKKKNFTISRKTSSQWKAIYEVLKKSKSAMSQIGFATQLDIQNFHRQVIKPSADPFELKVYPLVENGFLYIVLPTRGQTANNRAKRVASTGIKWQVGGGSSEFIRFCKNKMEAKEVMRKVKESGIVIDNMDELGKQFNMIRLGKQKAK